jgi:hypothetical protein
VVVVMVVVEEAVAVVARPKPLCWTDAPDCSQLARLATAG